MERSCQQSQYANQNKRDSKSIANKINNVPGIAYWNQREEQPAGQNKQKASEGDLYPQRAVGHIHNQAANAQQPDYAKRNRRRFPDFGAAFHSLCRP